MMRLTTRALGLLALALAFSPGQARAELMFTMRDVGPDVVVTGSGTANTAGLSHSGSWVGGQAVRPEWGLLLMANPSGGFTGSEGDRYSGITGPASFGSGGLTGGTSASGSDAFGIEGRDPIGNAYIYFPFGYVSGSPLSGSMTFAGKTLSDLGATPGKYTWIWGSGANADSAVLNIIGDTPAVPEPSSLVLSGTGAVALVGYARRRGKARAA
jgi:hypothetical protein